MYENDIGIILFRNYGSWPNLKTKKNIASNNLHKTAHEKFQNILLP